MMRVAITALLGLLAGTALLGGCPETSPDTEKKIQEAVKIPGLAEAVKAKDLALKAAIIAGWRSDVELMQEQLVVEDIRAGKVRITGIVSREELKERAENIAREQKGVVDVVSTITVDESLREKRFNLDEI
ncbi:BON domain-containing protein [bacterium]|nr:BON domain-containing protein [bacterium]